MSDDTKRSAAMLGSQPGAWNSFPEHRPPEEVCLELRLRCGRKFFGANEGTDAETDSPVFVIDSRQHPDGEVIPCEEVEAWRLHRPTLTDEEREAIKVAADDYSRRCDGVASQTTDALYALLRRTK